MKVDKKTFWELLDFLAGFGGFTDLEDEPMKEELWAYYQKEELGGNKSEG